MHHVQNLCASIAQGLLAKKADAATDRGQGVAQIVPEHRYELFAKRGCVLFIEQVPDGAELEADHFREHFEHLNGFGRLQPMRFRIDGAQSPKKRSVGRDGWASKCSSASRRSAGCDGRRKRRPRTHGR